MTIYLFPEQLHNKLTKKSCHYCYILFGNDTFLLNDTKNSILKYIKSFNSCMHYDFTLNNKSPLEKIIAAYQKESLFDHKKKFFHLLFLKKNLIKTY